MRLAKVWLVAGLTLFMGTTASAQSIAIPKSAKTAAPMPATPIVVTPLAQPVAAPRTKAQPRASAATADNAATYTYDSLGRLIKDAYPSNTASYTYDAAGNRTQAQFQ